MYVIFNDAGKKTRVEVTSNDDAVIEAAASTIGWEPGKPFPYFDGYDDNGEWQYGGGGGDEPYFPDTL